MRWPRAAAGSICWNTPRISGAVSALAGMFAGFQLIRTAGHLHPDAFWMMQTSMHLEALLFDEQPIADSRDLSLDESETMAGIFAPTWSTPGAFTMMQFPGVALWRHLRYLRDWNHLQVEKIEIAGLLP